MKIEKVLKVTFTEEDVKSLIRAHVAKDQGLNYGETEDLNVRMHFAVTMQIQGDDTVPVARLNEVVVIGNE